MIPKWRADDDTFSQQMEEGNGKKRKCESGRQTLFSELEDLICELTSDRRAKTLDVRRTDIKASTLAMAPILEISQKKSHCPITVQSNITLAKWIPSAI